MVRITGSYEDTGTRKTNWYGDVVRKHWLDFHVNDWVTEYVSNVDPEEQARIFAEAGIQAVGIFFKDHFGNCAYPTDIGHRHPNLARDYAGDMAFAVKDHGLRPLAYYSVGVERYSGLNNQTWQMRDEHGHPRRGAWVMERGIGAAPCINSPYTEKVVLPEMAEISERYPVEAFLLDMATWQVMMPCYCQFCESAFRKETGDEIPKESENRLAFSYRKWRNRHLYDFHGKVKRTLDSVRPGILLGDNIAYGVSFPDPPSEHVDYLFHDPASGGLYPLNLSFEGRFFTTTGYPYEQENVSSQGWGDCSLRPTASLQVEVATNLMNGSTLSLTDQPYPDGSIEPEVYRAIGEVYGYVKKIEDACTNTTSEPYVAVLHSAASHWSRGPLAWPEPFQDAIDAVEAPGIRADRSWARYLASGHLDPVQGAHKALVESGIHIDIVNEHALERQLDEYAAVVLPEQVALSERTVDLLREFVRAGGGLVATGAVATKDGENNPLDDFALSDVLGVSLWEKSPYPIGYLKPYLEFATNSRMHNMRMLVDGDCFQIQVGAADVVAELVDPIQSWLETDEPERFFTVQDRPGPGNVTRPGITLNKYGHGSAAYVAAELCGGYKRTNAADLKHILARCLDLVTSLERRKLEVDCPPSVEVALRRKGEDLILHLVNYHAEKREVGTPAVEWLPRVGPVSVKLRCSRPRSVTQIPEKKALDWTFDEGTITFELPPFDIHTCAQIKLT